jgi:hypothetical protein
VVVNTLPGNLRSGSHRPSRAQDDIPRVVTLGRENMKLVDIKSWVFRIHRASPTVSKHIVHFKLIPRALSIRGDGPEIVSVE